MSTGDLIVNAFLQYPGQIISGEELANRIGVSRTAVWKAVSALKKEGYGIEVLKGKGYRLQSLSKRPIPREIKRCLKTKRLGNTIFYFEKTHSTNDSAKKLAREGALDGALVIAEEQFKGRGRRHRIWESPKGGVYMSLILRPRLPPSDITRITLLAGLAVFRAIKKLHHIDIRLKWPNDLILNDKKLGGILCEMEGEAEGINFIVIGIGLNVNSDVDVDIPTTSIKKAAGKEAEISIIVREILNEMEMLYEGFLKNPGAFLNEYREVSQTLGRDVKVLRQGRKTLVGKALDIEEDGGLLLRLSDGSYEKVLSGEITYLR